MQFREILPILVPIIFVSTLLFVVVLRVNGFNDIQSDDSHAYDFVEGMILSHPYHSDQYQVFEVSGVRVKTTWYPEYSVGESVSFETNGKPYVYYPGVVVKGGKPLLIATSSLRRWFIQRIKRNLPEPHASLILGMTVGYQPDFPQELDQLLKDVGVVHVIVVSGYNVSLILGMVAVILARFGRKIFLAGSLVFLGMFLILAGFEPPVIRATIMGSIGALSMATGEARQNTYLLIVTGLIMLAINPAFISDIGFQLSFVATFGVILASNNSYDRPVWLQEILVILYVNLMVWPLLSFYFGRVSIVSPLVNLLVLWTIPFVTLSGFLLAVLPVLPLKVFLIALIDYFLFLSQWFGEISWAVIEYQIGLKEIVIYYFVLFIVQRIIQK